MSAAAPAPAPLGGNSSRGGGGRPTYRVRRGPRRGDTENIAEGRNTASVIPSGVSDPSLSLQPAANVQEVSDHSQNSQATTTRGNNARERGWRGGRSTKRGGASGRTVTTGNRVFGAQLTSNQGEPTTPVSASASASLQADAPEFRPGQPVPQRSASNHPPARSRRMSKSQAPDLATRTHEDIAHGLYECPICTVEVYRSSKIWSCKTCWTVFHLLCIQRWSKNEGSTQQQQPAQDGEMPPSRQWRCPGCNLPKDELPTSYSCWCSKEIDPKPIPGIPPHSCGQTCGKPRVPRKCPHPCELSCHAGPCSPCPHMGPTQACFCGKEALARRCVKTDYETGWSCGEVCGDVMPCNEHTCGRGCHEGLCGSCDVLVESRCYCGKVEKQVLCSERGEQKRSSLLGKEGEIDSWDGSFDCGNVCKRLFDCGVHSCEMICHTQEESPPHCPFSPDVVSQCPCGKTSLTEINCLRESCRDSIPHCQQRCQRALPCGHSCQQKCHSGTCMPCLDIVSIKCRCGRTSSNTICHQGSEELPQCARTCKALLNCGRHECGERCCPAEKMAGERQAAKRKMKSINTGRNAGEDIEAEHICMRTCGRQLKCGNEEHICQELCHRGPCGSCREAIFDEIACHCGKTVLQPPLACGTQTPVCQYQCDRPKGCGHPEVPHQCHMEDSCPKCPYLVQKACMCGKAMLKNQPCWSLHISCGQPCGRRLRCGIHYCAKSCHRPGECENFGASCSHTCGQKKTAPGCGHPCLERCHAPYPCKEEKPCQAKVIVTCECQHQKQELRCLATKSASGASNSERPALPCNEECLRLQRNQKLAQALNISPDHQDGHIPYSSTTLEIFKDNVKWCQIQEREFRVFAADRDEKRFRFKPMASQQRAFVHSLAEDFGLDSESMDPEPHRHVSIFKTPRFVSAPMKTLSQCLNIKPATQTVTASASNLTAVEAGQPYNALILSSPRFALTIDELRTHLRADLSTVPNSIFEVMFIPSEEIVIYRVSDLQRPQSSSTNGMASMSVAMDAAEAAQTMLSRLKPLVQKTVVAHELARSVALCRIDTSLNVRKREIDQGGNGAGDGWSQVVKGSVSTKARDLAVVGVKSSFTVLGRIKMNEAREGSWRDREVKRERLVLKQKQEPVLENWETAVDGEE